MTGFPKTLTDFSQNRYSHKELQKPFEKHIQFYLKNQNFLKEKKEIWKHFPFQKFLNKNFNFNLNPLSKKYENKTHIPSSLFLSVQNGQISSLPQSDKNIFICSWQDVLHNKVDLDPEIKNQILSALQQQRNTFCSLSNTFYPKGMILVIKKSLSKILEIHYSHNAEDQEQGLNLRNFIFIQDQASAQIVEIFYSCPENKALFLNIQTDCFVGEKAKLEHSRLDQTDSKDILIHQLFAKLYPEGTAQFFTLSLNAGASCWFSEFEQEKKTVSSIKGLSLLDKNSHSDHTVKVNHKGVKGQSHQLYKSFLFDSARQIFQGLVSIEKQAQRSDTSQLSRNFLFGQKAFAVAFPELDISADDVKAGHGATVSSFSENKELLFYLRSRGVDSQQAFHLLLFSFIEETLSGLKTETKKLARILIQKKLGQLKSFEEQLL